MTDNDRQVLKWVTSDSIRGELVCSVCDPVTIRRTWCDHIETVVKSGKDEQLIWNSADGSSHELPKLQTVSVPIFTEYDCWANVSLYNPVDGPAYRVKFTPLKDSSSDLEEKGLFIGFLNEGEGRWVLRDMLLTYAYPRLQDVQCKNVNHKFRQQMLWEKAVQGVSRTLATAYKWSVFESGACPPCRWAGESYSIDSDDLIPDLGGKRPHPLSSKPAATDRPRSFTTSATPVMPTHLTHIHFDLSEFRKSMESRGKAYKNIRKAFEAYLSPLETSYTRERRNL